MHDFSLLDEWRKMASCAMPPNGFPFILALWPPGVSDALDRSQLILSSQVQVSEFVSGDGDVVAKRTHD
ncbi:MAG: hypothetical protein D6723_07600 [Acidobacteria bacterium]|nr:MAG: hypothetical protein D6723_07600 [Acidobacteriota bacterium]